MRKNNGGMSFIELVLVIVILSLVTTEALPSISPWDLLTLRKLQIL